MDILMHSIKPFNNYIYDGMSLLKEQHNNRVVNNHSKECIEFENYMKFIPSSMLSLLLKPELPTDVEYVDYLTKKTKNMPLSDFFNKDASQSPFKDREDKTYNFLKEKMNLMMTFHQNFYKDFRDNEFLNHIPDKYQQKTQEKHEISDDRKSEIHREAEQIVHARETHKKFVRGEMKGVGNPNFNTKGRPKNNGYVKFKTNTSRRNSGVPESPPPSPTEIESTEV